MGHGMAHRNGISCTYLWARGEQFFTKTHTDYFHVRTRQPGPQTKILRYFQNSSQKGPMHYRKRIDFEIKIWVNERPDLSNCV